MLLVPVISTLVGAMGYDEASAELQVQFVNGKIYSYTNVPPTIYDALSTSPDVGSFFCQNIRKFPGLYPYRRIL